MQCTRYYSKPSIPLYPFMFSSFIYISAFSTLAIIFTLDYDLITSWSEYVAYVILTPWTNFICVAIRSFFKKKKVKNSGYSLWGTVWVSRKDKVSSLRTCLATKLYHLLPDLHTDWKVKCTHTEILGKFTFIVAIFFCSSIKHTPGWVLGKVNMWLGVQASRFWVPGSSPSCFTSHATSCWCTYREMAGGVSGGRLSATPIRDRNSVSGSWLWFALPWLLWAFVETADRRGDLRVPLSFCFLIKWKIFK